MKFSVKNSDLLKALDVVGIVPPKPISIKGAEVSVYLFVVKGDLCYVYSRDPQQVARAQFPIFDVEGEGAFTYPADHVRAFKFIGEVCTFEAKQDGDQFIVRYDAGSGATAEKTAIDPKFLATCEQDLNSATDSSTFSAAILREGINMSRNFLPPKASKNAQTVDEHFNTLQVFDKKVPDWAKGDGHLFASNSIQAFFFYCDEFAGKNLEIHSNHLSALTSFLAKCEGTVTLKRGQNYTFAVDDKDGSRVLGWLHQSRTHGKFSYYSLKSDQFVFSAPKEVLLGALNYIRAELDPMRDKTKVIYDHADSTLRFSVLDGTTKAESFRVPVKIQEPAEAEGRNSLARERGYTVHVNINHFIELIKDIKANEVELRTALLTPEGRKESAFFRIVDDFRMDAGGKVVIEAEGSHRCRVTRFMPSKD